jgi:hypothetical protein
MLELLERLKRIEFIHRDVATRAELERYLDRWISSTVDYHVIYLAFHGSASGISISDDEDGVVTLDHLGDRLADKLTGCVVHFGSCAVMKGGKERFRRFLGQTGARAITGYDDDVPWIESAALDLIVLGMLSSYRQLGTALNRLESDKEYASLRRALGFRVMRA